MQNILVLSQWTLPMMPVGMIGIFCIFIGVIFFFKSIYDGLNKIVPIVFAIVFVFGIFLEAQPFWRINRYKVTFTGNVNMQQFTQKYNIVDQDGLVYEVEKR